MSDHSSHDPPIDRNRLKVAPPPPPPAELVLGRSAHQTTGFNPHGGRVLTEVIGVVVVAVVLGALVIALGGRIAAWTTAFVPLSVDRTMGEISQKQFAMMSADCENPEALAYVREVARPLLAAAGPLPFSFEFRVASDAQVNAFALPGGFVTVNFGLLDAAQSGDEVAGVIGHEIQHALLRHGTKRMLRQMGSGALLFLIFGGTDLHAVGQTAGQFAALSYDRREESEADLRGVELLVKAEISPLGLATFFERLAADSLNPPAFLSTHPDPGDRAAFVAKAANAGKFHPLPSPQGLKCHLP